MKGCLRIALALPGLFAGSAAWGARAPMTLPAPIQVDGAVCSAGLGCRVVGPGGGACDFPTVQQAVAANASEIRVVSGIYAENVSIADRNIVISGGFASCADAANGVDGAAGARSTIAPAAGRALLIQQGGTSGRPLYPTHVGAGEGRCGFR